MSQVHSRIFSRRSVDKWSNGDQNSSRVTLTQSDLLVWKNRWPRRVKRARFLLLMMVSTRIILLTTFPIMY